MRVPVSPSSSSSASSTMNSELFYCGTPLTFQVEETTFRVPREGFEKATTFADLYGIKPSTTDDDTTRDFKFMAGMNVDVVEIKDITANEFTAFLKLLFRPIRGFDQYELSEVELVFALKLSTMWKFDAVREETISRIEALSLQPAHIIEVAHLYEVNRWITPAIERLALRPQSLTVDEMKQVGLETVAEIMAHRDMRSFLTMDILKDRITEKDLALVDTCIAQRIREQRGSSDRSNDEQETDINDEDKDATGREVKQASEAINSEITSKTRFEVQEEIERSNKERDALESRLHFLQAKLEEIGSLEEREHLQAKVASMETNLEEEKGHLLKAKVVLAEALNASSITAKKSIPPSVIFARHTLRDTEARVQVAEEQLASALRKLEESDDARADRILRINQEHADYTDLIQE